jgi:excinuclease UvrABC nuclease subunit
MAEYFIYRFFDKDNVCLYVGKTIHLKPRFLQHKQDKDWFNEVVKIEYAQLPKGREFMVDLYEIHYINILGGKYNAKDINVLYQKWTYPELAFKEYDMRLLSGRRKRKM